MKFIEINARFTAIVAEYIGKGYTINAGTMSGSQGEIAHIDLTDGNEVIRIMVENFIERGNVQGGCRIVVGRSGDTIKPHDSDSMRWAIWNNHLEVIRTENFYEIGEDRYTGKEYGTKEQAEKAAEISEARSIRRSEINAKRERDSKLTAHGMEIARKFIRRKTGLKRVNSSMVTISHNSKGGYIIRYNGRCFYL